MQYLIDASVYVFRAHFSMPDDMVDDNGNPINALYGFCRFLGDFMEQVKPEYVAVLFDESLSKSFRTEIYPEYKATSFSTPTVSGIIYLQKLFQWVCELFYAPKCSIWDEYSQYCQQIRE